MKFFQFFAFTFILLFSNTILFGNTTKEDSLLNAFKSANQGKPKIDVARSLTLFYATGGNKETAWKYVEEAKKIAKESDNQELNFYSHIIEADYYSSLNDYQNALISYEKAFEIAKKLNKKGLLGTAHYNIGETLHYQGDSKKALEHLKAAISFLTEKDNIKQLERTYNILGIVEKSFGNYDKALEYQVLSMKINEETNNYSMLADSYINIGVSYFFKGQFDKAIEFFHKALVIEEKNRNKPGMSILLNNIGVIYKRQANYEKAIEYYSKALLIEEELQNKEKVGAYTLNIGLLHLELKRYPDALNILERSLQVRKELSNPSNIGSTLIALGKLHLLLKNYTQSALFLEEAISLKRAAEDKKGMVDGLEIYGKTLQKLNRLQESEVALNEALLIARANKYKAHEWEIFLTLSSLDSLRGNFKSAYQNYYISNKIKDSLASIEKQQQIEELQAKYETERKDKEIHLLNSENVIKQAKIGQQEIIRNILVGSLTIIFIFSLLLIKSNKEKSKANKVLVVKNEEIEIQKEEILNQKQFLQELNEEILQQKFHLEEINNLLFLQNEQIESKNMGITSSISYALRIQKAILPPMQSLKGGFKEIFVFYKPKDIVSGDYYWFKQKENNVYLACIDCTGHGVPGAFMSLISYNILQNIIDIEGSSKPAEIIQSLHSEIVTILNQEETGNNDGLELSLVKYNQIENTIEVSGARHNFYVVDETGVDTLSLSRNPVGGAYLSIKRPFRDYIISTQALRENTTFYLTTDGFTDQFGGEKNKKFSRRRFRELIGSIYHKPLDEQEAILKRCFGEWAKNYEQVDDILIIGFRL
jgi:tetratricopeptide (TPR) repeat protein